MLVEFRSMCDSILYYGVLWNMGPKIYHPWSYFDSLKFQICALFSAQTCQTMQPLSRTYSFLSALVLKII